jgi:Ca-activated chloride channel family protein
MPLIRLHDLLWQSLAHSERISGLLLLGFLVIAAMCFGALLRRQVRKSWLGRTDGFSATIVHSPVALTNQSSNQSPRKRRLSPYQPKAWAPVVRIAALVLVGIAATDPRLGRGRSDAARSSEQIVLLLDRSRSMLAADAEPTRFGLARRVAADVIDRAQGAAIAIVSFASDARIESPLSRDASQLREQIDVLKPEQDGRSGTELAQGLKLAMDSFASRFAGPKQLIVLTDGETHEPVSLAGVRMPEGISVLFLGIGDSVKGARIPLKAGESSGLFDSPQYFAYEGKTVWTKSHPERLAELAHRLNGRHQMITSPAQGSRIISAARGDVQKSLRWERLSMATPVYSPLVFAALVLLVLESLLPYVDRPWWDSSPRQVRHVTATAFLAMLVLCLVSASPPPKTVDTYNRGVEAYQASAWQEAENQFRLAMAGEEPIACQASFNLANTQYQRVRKDGMSKQEAMSRLQECIACYRHCIHENQRCADARANLQIAYALLKQIEKQEPTNRQSGSDDQGPASSPPRSNNQRTERGEGDKPRQSPEKLSANRSAADASKRNKPGENPTSPPEANRAKTQDKLTDAAAENELRRIRDQARPRSSGKKPVLAGPSVHGGPPW